MHKIRQILLFLDRGVSQRAIEKEVQITRKTIALYLQKFQQSLTLKYTRSFDLLHLSVGVWGNIALVRRCRLANLLRR
jgi:DNA-binding NarL/FixJ family response regulator